MVQALEPDAVIDAARKELARVSAKVGGWGAGGGGQGVLPCRLCYGAWLLY